MQIKKFFNRVKKKIRSWMNRITKYINYKIVVPIAYKRYCRLPHAGQ